MCFIFLHSCCIGLKHAHTTVLQRKLISLITDDHRAYAQVTAFTAEAMLSGVRKLLRDPHRQGELDSRSVFRHSSKAFCLLFVVCCLLFVVCCLLFVVCCLLFVVCCL